MKSQLPGADRATLNRSTGPRSAAGKARSSMNALKSGIYSQSLIIPGEDPAHLVTLTNEYFDRYRPSTPEQRDQIDILVRSTWSLRRLAVAEAQVWIYEMDRTSRLNAAAPIGHAFHDCDRTLTRLSRIVNSTQRNYRDALREIERLQAIDPANGPASTVSYVPQPQAESPSAPADPPQPPDTKPLTDDSQFVPSTPEPEWVAPPDYHLPGSRCPFRPIEPAKFKRCPVCFGR